MVKLFGMVNGKWLKEEGRFKRNTDNTIRYSYNQRERGGIVVIKDTERLEYIIMHNGSCQGNIKQLQVVKFILKRVIRPLYKMQLTCHEYCKKLIKISIKISNNKKAAVLVVQTVWGINKGDGGLKMQDYNTQFWLLQMFATDRTKKEGKS